MDSLELKESLKVLGWSQAELSRRIGCDISTVSRWATGKVDVPEYLAEYLRVVRLAKQIVEGG